jgi:RNA polymerase sigma-70 factor, ECF subfamily
MSQSDQTNGVYTRTRRFVLRERATRPTKAIESSSKRLEHLLGLIAAGKDQNAFAELYSATRRKLFSTVLLIVGRPDLAEEVLQEAFVRIWSNASVYRSSRGSAMTWMIAVTRNIAIDYVRKPTREAQSDETVLLQLRSDDPSALEAIEAQEDQQMAICQRQIALAALQGLDPERRDLVIAAYIYGESREQLAKARGVPVSTVKTWIRRALLEVEAAVRQQEQRVPARNIATNTTDVRRDAAFLYMPRAVGTAGLAASSRYLSVV